LFCAPAEKHHFESSAAGEEAEEEPKE
jgi:hypothetical protein